MQSVADALRAEAAASVARLPPGERLRLALRLGDDDLRLYAARRQVDCRTARLELERARQSGRTPSRCMRERFG